jgi:hypothetical protein
MTGKELGGQPVTGHGDGLGNVFTGLTKREWFAGKALAGILSNPHMSQNLNEATKELGCTGEEYVSKTALAAADALLIELSKEGQ